MALTYEQQTGQAPAPPEDLEDTPEIQAAAPAPAPIFNTNPMYGTTHTNFVLVGVFATGRVGYRELSGTEYRVRVEPAAGVTLPFPTGWSTPNPTNPRENRYSIVVWGDKNLNAALGHASQILATASI
jgi:hypothetical protein